MAGGCVLSLGAEHRTCRTLKVRLEFPLKEIEFPLGIILEELCMETGNEGSGGGLEVG